MEDTGWIFIVGYSSAYPKSNRWLRATSVQYSTVEIRFPRVWKL